MLLGAVFIFIRLIIMTFVIDL